RARRPAARPRSPPTAVPTDSRRSRAPDRRCQERSRQSWPQRRTGRRLNPRRAGTRADVRVAACPTSIRLRHARTGGSREPWADRHPHDEINYVLSGELHVESDGETVIARPGDTVVVRAGSLGVYTAPVQARMLAIYGPNPDGLESDSFEYRDI